jgi:hypothetical protein
LLENSDEDRSQERDQENPGSSEEEKPDPNVKPPKFDVVTHGYDPSKIKNVGGSKDNKNRKEN